MATKEISEALEIPIVSIHATLAGGDSSSPPPSAPPSKFLSTPPSRVATGAVTQDRGGVGVSIHATLAGGDPIGP